MSKVREIIKKIPITHRPVEYIRIFLPFVISIHECVTWTFVRQKNPSLICGSFFGIRQILETLQTMKENDHGV